jgi:hypothetical protein
MGPYSPEFKHKLSHSATQNRRYVIVIDIIDRHQWPRGLKHGSVAARLLGLWVRIPPEARCPSLMRLRRVRGLCDGPITRPEESYRV